MRQKIGSIIFVFVFISFSAISGEAQSPKELDEEVKNQQDIIQYFAEHDAPVELTKTKDSKFTVYHIVDAAVSEHLPNEELVNEVRKCNLVYLVDVEIKRKGKKYLYCMDKSIITLMSVYEFNGKEWVRK